MPSEYPKPQCVRADRSAMIPAAQAPHDCERMGQGAARRAGTWPGATALGPRMHIRSQEIVEILRKATLFSIDIYRCSMGVYALHPCFHTLYVSFHWFHVST